MKVTRRHFIGGMAVLAAGAGCDQMPKGWLPMLASKPVHNGPFTAPAGQGIDLISQSLNRLTFGPRPWDYAAVRSMGATEETAYEAFVEQQLAPERLDDSWCDYHIRRFETLAQPAGEMFEYQEHLLLSELMRSTVLRAVLTERQLFEVMTQFWSDHFNIDPSKGDCQWLKPVDDHDVVRKHALGKFPDLLRASALSPAMLWYLDGRVNQSRNPSEKPNENYARELMELHTLGVHGGYTQRDVMEVARCLTGWTVRSGEKFQKGKVEFRKERHDDGPKEVLGHKIPGGLGEKDLDRVLDIVAYHPSTARYLAMKLCRRFIADDPPASAVSTVGETFQRTRGDIRETLRAVFSTPEFKESRGTKFKRPFHFVVSALRTTDAQSNADESIIDYLLRMGHAPFNYPTPDGYPEEAQPWLGTLLWRWNFGVALSANKLKGTKIQLDELRRRLGDQESLMAHFLGRRPTQTEVGAYNDSGDGLALLLGSPGFQRC
jgi:uncharacterized protein (DUF1800 family)